MLWHDPSIKTAPEDPVLLSQEELGTEISEKKLYDYMVLITSSDFVVGFFSSKSYTILVNNVSYGFI